MRARRQIAGVIGHLWIACLFLAFGWALMPAPSSPPVVVALALDSSPSPTSPTITLSVTTGPPGTAVTITGSGFPPQEFVALYIDQPVPYLGTPGPRADAEGAFAFQIKWPDQTYDVAHKVNPATGGVHTVCGDTSYGGISQQYPAKACTQFVAVGPRPSPTAQSPAPSTPSSRGAGLPEVIGAIAVLLALAVGAVWFLRRPS